MLHKQPFIINKIQERRVTPPPSVWNRLEEKLKRRKVKKKVVFYRNLSFAASFVALICIGVILSDNFNTKHKKAFATNHLYTPAVLEELPIVENDPFYSSEKLIHQSHPGYQVKPLF